MPQLVVVELGQSVLQHLFVEWANLYRPVVREGGASVKFLLRKILASEVAERAL